MEKKLKIKKLKGYANKFTLQGEQEDNEYFVDQGRHLKY
jgi:hypothetical protein